MSKLKGRKPKDVKPRKPKLLLWGVAGVGKTFAACSFPKPYVIDSEGGASFGQYQEMIEQSGGAYVGVEDGALHFPTVLQQIDALACEKHDYKTLVIDSVTKLWDNEVAIELERMKRAGEKPSFGNQNQPAVRYFQQVVRLVNRMDMNVVLIAAEKSAWKGGEFAGEAPDCWPRLAYELDASMQLLNLSGTRQVKIHKNRLPQLHGQKEPIFYPFSKKDIYGLFGKELLEGEQEVYVKASDESVGRLTALCSECEVLDAEVAKWLTAANADSFSEMTQDQVDKCIAALEKRKAA